MELELRQNTLKFEELSKAIEQNNVQQKRSYIKKELQPQTAVFDIVVQPSEKLIFESAQVNEELFNAQPGFSDLSDIQVDQSQPKLRKHEFLQSLTIDERRRIELESVVLMQKWVRGHLARITCRKQKEINFKQMRKLRRLLSVAYGRLRNKLIK